MNKVIDLLEIGRLLIKKGWCQNALSLDSQGQSVHPSSISASKWCVLGAIASQMSDDNVEEKVIHLLNSNIPDNTFSIQDFNDLTSTSKTDVLGLFDKAIRKAQTHE